MPAGMSWPRYLTFFAATILSGFGGAQVVHNYYKPLADIDELVEQELERRRKAKELTSS